jgi:hemerythrin superfamily protein
MNSATRQASGKKSSDIIDLILNDHKALKRLIKVLKNSDASLSDREDAFEEFAPLLVTHAVPEQETLYQAMRGDDELRAEGFEGEVEHELADQMLEEAKRTEDDDLWSARVKVLAELVEHHIKEEEDELLPDYKKASELSERVELANEFLRLKQELHEQGDTDSPSERYIDQHPQQ